MLPETRAIVPVRLGVWAVSILAGGVVVLSLSNHQTLVSAVLRGMTALIVLSSLLWALARLWRIPIVRQPEPPKVEDVPNVEPEPEPPPNWDNESPEDILKTLARYDRSLVEAE